MKKIHPRWKSMARSAIAFSIWLVLLCGAHLGLQAQSTFYTYGKPGLNDGGTVILPDVAGYLLPNHFLIGGYTYGPSGDSTFIMELDLNGVVYNTAVFKLSDPGSNDRLTDMKFDANGSVIGCGYNFGAPNDNNGWYFKMPNTFGPLTWDFRIQTGGSGEVFQPFCILEALDASGNPFEYVLSGKKWDPTGPFENSWVAHVDRTTGTLSTHNWLDFLPDQADLFVNMLQFNNILFTLGDVDYASGVPINGFIRPAITPLDNMAHTVVAPGAHSYLANTTTTPEIHASDFIDLFNQQYLATGYGFMKYNVFAWNTFWLNRTVNGVTTDPILHFEYDLPFVQSEISEEVVEFGPSTAVMLVAGDDPGSGRNIYLAAADIITGAPLWARRFGNTTDGEYLFHGSQSQMAVIGTDLFFIGIRENGGIEDALLVKVSSYVPNLEGCVTDELLANGPLLLDSLFKWNEHMDVQKELSLNEPVLIAPLPGDIACASCPMANDPAYTTITTGVPAGGYVIWPDKVYVPAGTTILVSGTLDVTQADVVLDECARIVIGEGGHIRANNSTFRPCDELKTWDGIYFDESATTNVPNASGFFNDCLFKNMLNGICVNATPTSGGTAFNVRITDNSFVNCFFGVRVNKAIMNDGITGNQFTLDNAGINYLPAGCPTVPPYTPANPFNLGIYAVDATFEGAISQNHFVNTLDKNNIGRFEGITLINVAEANITLNRFTNMWYSVGIVSSQNVAVENNEVEITQQYNSQEVQIFFERSSEIWVDGNHLTNSVENYTAGLRLAAIYCEDSRFFNIKENTIDGFIAGIEVLRTLDSSQVLENRITNCDLVGIWIEEGKALDVACNSVKLRRHDPAGTIGIRYQTVANVAPVAMRFRGNCVFNTGTAMAFINPGALCIPLPLIRNNFLYNYTTAGMIFTQFNGSVGTSNAIAALSGHNTFTSNNFPLGAIDVINSTPGCGVIQVGGNWGILAFTPGIGIVAPAGDVFHSYADCALQIGNQTVQEWTARDQCDRFRNNITVLIPNIIGGGYDEFDATMGDQGASGYARMALWQVVHETDIATATPFYDHIMAGNLLSAQDKGELRYDWLLYRGDYTAALGQLQALGASERVTPFFRQLEELRLTMLSQGRSWESMTATELQSLQDLAAASDPNADVARAYLNAVTGDKPYEFEPIYMPEAAQSIKSLEVRTDVDHMEIFPNPSHDKLNVKFNLANEAAPVVRVTDLLGRTVYKTQLDFGAGTFTLDISTYTPGAYVVSLESGHGKSLYKQLVKQ